MSLSHDSDLLQALRAGNAIQARKCLGDILNDESTYTFSEFLSANNVQNDQQLTDTLHLYAWGTYKDYIKNPSGFLPLSPQHIRKLRLLTIASLWKSVIPLFEVASEIGVQAPFGKFNTSPGVWEVDELIVDAMSRGLIKGSIDHDCGVLQISAVLVARDIRRKIPQDVAADLDFMLETMGQWRTKSGNIMATLNETIKASRREENELICSAATN